MKLCRGKVSWGERALLAGHGDVDGGDVDGGDVDGGDEIRSRWERLK